MTQLNQLKSDADVQGILHALRIVMAWKSPAGGKAGEKGESGLREAAKLTYIHLALAAGGVGKTIFTSCTSIAAAIGGSRFQSDRAVKALHVHGLIDLPPGRYRGEFPVYISNPEAAAVAWKARTAGDDGQGELPFPDDASNRPDGDAEPWPATMPLGSPAAQPPHDSTAAAGDALSSDPDGVCVHDSKPVRESPGYPHAPHSPLSVLGSAHAPSSMAIDYGARAGDPRLPAQTSGLPHSRSTLDAGNERRGVERLAEMAVRKNMTPAPVDSASTVGSAVFDGLNKIAARMRQTPEQVEAEVQRRVQFIRDRVADPNLGRWSQDGRECMTGEAMVKRIAWALVEGELEQRHLDAAIDALNYFARHNNLKSRAGYFMGTMKRRFARLSLQWDLGKFEPARTDRPAQDPNDAPIP